MGLIWGNHLSFIAKGICLDIKYHEDIKKLLLQTINTGFGEYDKIINISISRYKSITIQYYKLSIIYLLS